MFRSRPGRSGRLAPAITITFFPSTPASVVEVRRIPSSTLRALCAINSENALTEPLHMSHA